MDFNTVFRSGDFNGDRIDDLASFNPTTGVWQYVLTSGSCFQGFSKPIVMGDTNSLSAGHGHEWRRQGGFECAGNLGPAANMS
jgi:hypothetical protein